MAGTQWFRVSGSQDCPEPRKPGLGDSGAIGKPALSRMPLAFFCVGHGASKMRGQAVVSPCERARRSAVGPSREPGHSSIKEQLCALEMQTRRSSSYQVGGANMYVPCHFIWRVPAWSGGCKAAAGPHERWSAGPSSRRKVKGAEIRQSQPQIVPVVLHEGGRSLVPCLSPPNLAQVGASRAELPEMGVTRWDRWELPSQTRKLGVGPL